MSTVKVVKSTDGADIYAEAIGDPAHPSVVLIHGVGLSATVFDNLFADSRLLGSVYLVRYDMRGHGRTHKPDTIEGYSSSIYSDDFLAVKSAFALHDPVCVGWSLGATVCADLCALDPLPISGFVYLAALPYIGPIMGDIGTPTVLGYLPGFFTTDDVALAGRTKVAFIDSLFADPTRVPVHVKWAWLGTTLLQSPAHTQHVLSRPQDPTALFAAGAAGLPLLIVHGTADMLVKGEAVVDAMRPHFRDLEVHMVEGGSHALFYDNEDEFVATLLPFVRRVTVGLDGR